MFDDFPGYSFFPCLNAQHIHARRLARKVEVDAVARQGLAADDGTRRGAENGLQPRVFNGVAHPDGELPVGGVGIERQPKARYLIGGRSQQR